MRVLPDAREILHRSIPGRAYRRHPAPRADGAVEPRFCLSSMQSFQGPNLTSIDPESGRLVKLYNPRRMRWSRHFAWDGPLLVGRTSIGRATVALLRINDGTRVELRVALIEEGRFP